MSRENFRWHVHFPSFILGIGVATLVLATVWLAHTGIRVDQQGTTTTAFEDVALWGGLAVGAALTVVGGMLIRRRSVPSAVTD